MMQMSLNFEFIYFLQKGSPSEFIRGRINSLKKQPSALPTHPLVNHHLNTVEVMYKVNSGRFCGSWKTGVAAASFDRNKERGTYF